MTESVTAQALRGSERTTGESLTMTVPELAQRVGVDASTAYRYLRAGTLPGVQAGNSWLIDRERVERFMAGLEDAAGRPLVPPPPANDAPALTVLPGRPPDTASLAIDWLRGLQAALGLLLDATNGVAPADDDHHQRHHLTGA